MKKQGEAYYWYSAKQNARIYIQEEVKSNKIITNSYKKLLEKDIYVIDYAKFLKNNEKFESAINLYTEIINSIEKIIFVS